MKEKRFCPKCKSENIEKQMNVLLAFGTPQLWKCNKCGFSNFEFPIKVEIKQSKKKN